MSKSFRLYIHLCLISLLSFSLLACQWGGDGTDEENEGTIIDDGANDDSINVDIDTEAGDIFDNEPSLHAFSMLNFNQDISVEKNSRYALYFDNFIKASSTEKPKDKEDQSANNLPLSQTSWVEELFSESYTIQWLDLSTPYNNPGTHYALIRPHQTLHVTGDKSGLLGTSVNSRNFPLIEAIKDNIFEHHLGATFIWDLNGLGDINKKENLHLDKFEDYEVYAGYPLLEKSTIWGDGQRFSDGAMLYSGIKKVNTERIVVESLISDGSYTIAAASFDGTGKTMNDIPIDYNNAGSIRLNFSYTLDFIQEHSVFLSFDAGTSNVYYHKESGSAAIAYSSYTIDSTLNLMKIDTQNLHSLPTAGTEQSDLLDQLNLTPYFSLAIVGPYADENGAEKFYFAKHFIESTPDNSALQKPVFYFNQQAYDDIQSQFFDWRDELLNDAY